MGYHQDLGRYNQRTGPIQRPRVAVIGDLIMSEEVKDAVVEPKPKPKKVVKALFEIQHDLHDAVVAHKQDPSEENEQAVKAAVKQLHKRIVKKKKR